VEELEPGAGDGVGRIARLHTKGKLPYTIHWVAQAVAIEKPTRLVVQATGDLVGRGEWRLKQSGEWVEISFGWTVDVTKTWMKILLPLLKPVYIANHLWAMQQGEAGLRQEIARRSGVESLAWRRPIISWRTKPNGRHDLRPQDTAPI
jgi:hypothetical protein